MKFEYNGKDLKDIMRMNFTAIPEQIKRLSVIVVVLVVLFIVARQYFIPEGYGKYGHYRAAAVDSIAALPVKYAGHQICADCHDDIVALKNSGYHYNVNCEACHGPAYAHTQGEDVALRIPDRKYCLLCHEYLSSRPTGFPQVEDKEHHPMENCVDCHDPHDPTPPETPTQCKACHAQIANLKSQSSHMYVACERCHVTPEEHKITPREVKPSIPTNREFCGECHDTGSSAPSSIPRVDIQTHHESYVCWQCHYPHFPEVK